MTDRVWLEKRVAWIRGPIQQDVTGMHLMRGVWREVQEILVGNTDRLPPSYWWKFMHDTYVTAQVIAVRRQLDTGGTVNSLARLVKDISEHPEWITRSDWESHWDSRERWLGDPSWTDWYSPANGEHLDLAIAARDADTLSDARAIIGAHADQHVAHSDTRAVAADAIANVGEIHDAIDTIGEIYARYYYLLTGSSHNLTPDIVDDWRAVFRVPWDAAT